MKKYNVFAISIMAIIISACSSGQKVEVVKASASSTITPVAKKEVEQPQLPPNLPRNVTAICRDGSYSTSTDSSACVANGGATTVINRYHAE